MSFIRLLHEGMRAGDLDELVLPMISVDEYVSTVDKNAIAIGFYVCDEDAASDLNRFLQKSSVAILSSEISPAPDQHGYYIVFVELMNNSRIGLDLEALLKEIEPLCEIAEWKIRTRKSKKLMNFSAEKFKDII